MREIGRMCRTFIKDNHSKWAECVGRIENLLNITRHYSTACTPHELHFGHPIKTDIETLIKFPEKRIIDHEYLVTLTKQNMMKNFEVVDVSRKSPWSNCKLVI